MAQPPAWGQSNFLNGERSGGALLDLHIHDVDFVQYCFGRPKSVFSTGFTKVSGAIDHVLTQYEVEGGAAVSAEGSWAMTGGFGFNMSYNVIFERATADYDLSRGESALKLFVEGAPAEVLKPTGIDGYAGEMQHLLDCVREGLPLRGVTPAEGVSALEICEAHGGKPDPNAADDENAHRSGAAGAWRNKFIRAPHYSEHAAARGILSSTFETSMTWDRMRDFHTKITKITRDTIKQVTGRDGFVTCRFTHVYPDGPCLYFTFGGLLDKRKQLEQFMQVLTTCTAATVEHGGTTTHHHAVGRFHRPFYDKQRPELFARALRGADAIEPGALHVQPQLEDGRRHQGRNQADRHQPIHPAAEQFGAHPLPATGGDSHQRSFHCTAALSPFIKAEISRSSTKYDPSSNSTTSTARPSGRFFA